MWYSSFFLLFDLVELVIYIIVADKAWFYDFIGNNLFYVSFYLDLNSDYSFELAYG